MLIPPNFHENVERHQNSKFKVFKVSTKESHKYHAMQKEINIGEQFLLLIDKDFPRQCRLYKTCSRQNVKISYSCMPNMGA